MYNTEQEAETREIPQTMRATFEKRKGQVCRIYTVKIQDSQQEQLKVPIEAKWLKKTILTRTMERHDIKVRPCGTKKKTVVLASSMPTTELCTSFGRFNNEMSLCEELSGTRAESRWIEISTLPGIWSGYMKTT